MVRDGVGQIGEEWILSGLGFGSVSSHRRLDAGEGLQICVQMTVTAIGNYVLGAVLCAIILFSLHSMKEVIFIFYR